MKKKHFLLVEDNGDLVALALQIFKKNNLSTHLDVVSNGHNALNYLIEKSNPNVYESFPVLVILDLNMPLMDGVETLKRIRSHPVIKHVPVVILTTSQDPEDIVACYDLGVNAYIVKPTAYKALEKTFLSIEDFWGGYNVPPPICA